MLPLQFGVVCGDFAAATDLITLENAHIWLAAILIVME
jgi:hypothetical protein